MAKGSNYFGIEAILNGKKDEPDDFFKILGCSESASDEQITAEYRIRALQCHPDKHPEDLKALEQFQKIQEAKEILLDPEKRNKYEKWRQREMCIPYKQWLSMSGRCATTMHWAKPKDQTMIESYSNIQRAELDKQFQRISSSPKEANVKWQSSSSSLSINSGQQHNAYVCRQEKTSSIYAKFRNYKI